MSSTASVWSSTCVSVIACTPASQPLMWPAQSWLSPAAFRISMLVMWKTALATTLQGLRQLLWAAHRDVYSAQSSGWQAGMSGLCNWGQHSPYWVQFHTKTLIATVRHLWKPYLFYACSCTLGMPVVVFLIHLYTYPCCASTHTHATHIPIPVARV